MNTVNNYCANKSIIDNSFEKYIDNSFIKSSYHTVNIYVSSYIEKEILKLCTRNSVTHFYKSYIINNLKDIPPEQIENYLQKSSIFRKSMIDRSEDIYILNNFSAILYDMWIFFRDECFRKYGNKK